MTTPRATSASLRVAAGGLCCALTAAALVAQSPRDVPLAVSGALVRENGAPVADAYVVLRPYPTRRQLGLFALFGQSALPEEADWVQTGADGAFLLTASGLGLYRLEVWSGEAEDAAPVLHYPLLPLAGSVLLPALELPASRPVTILVEDVAGEPVPGALIVVEPKIPAPASYARFASLDGRAASPLKPARVSAPTDSGGLARFRLPPGQRDVVVSAPGYALNGGELKSSRARFQLERDAGKVLRVRDPAGEPAPGTVLALAGEPGAPVAWTDERGESVVGVAGDRGVTLEFLGPDHAAAAVQVGNGSEGGVVEVRLEPPTTIRGRIVDAETGEAVVDAVAWLASDPGRNGRSDRFGAVELAVPAEGGRLEVAAVGYASADVRITPARVESAAPVPVGLTPVTRLWGRVVDGLGRPIPGAEVRFEAVGRGPFLGPAGAGAGRVASGSDGSFLIATASHGVPYRLTVGAPGYASAVRQLPALERGSEAAPVRVVLTSGLRPWGTVQDAAGAPVADARVSLLWPPEFPELKGTDFLPEAADAVVSSAGGEFEFPHVAPGSYGVRVVHPDYLDLRWQGANVPEGEGYVDLGAFTLTTGEEIRGRVSDPKGRPVAGAEVTARQARGQLLESQKRSALTDGEGNFRLRGLIPTVADLAVLAEGYAAAGVESVRPSTDERIEIELSPGATLAGVVLKPSGDVAAGVDVRLLSPRMLGTALPFEATARFSATDRDGRFRLENLLPGLWPVEVGDAASGTATDQVELAPGEVREIELRLREGNRLTVLVTNPRDQPVAGAEVRAHPEGDDTAYGRTDASGRVDLQLPAGAVMVEARHPDLLSASRSVTLNRGANELRLQLDAGWEIRGVVRTVDGAPLAGASVEAGLDPGLPEGSEERARFLAFSRLMQETPRTVSGVDGGFRLRGLDRGVWQLSATLAGYAPRRGAQQVEIDGRSIAGVVIEMSSSSSVRGRVTGIEPAEMATVEVRAWQGALFRGAAPDFEGNFELDALAAGEWRIVAAGRERRSVERTVTVRVGDSAGFVELPFEPGFRVAGRVLFDGVALGGAAVSVIAPDGRRARRTRTDPQGGFLVAGLRPGSYRLRVRHEVAMTQEQPLDVQSDQDGLVIHLQEDRAPGE